MTATKALERLAELIDEQPTTMAPTVREALAWGRLEAEVSTQVWEEARQLATAEPEPEPRPEPEEPIVPLEPHPPSDDATYKLRQYTNGDAFVAIPRKLAKDYPSDQLFTCQQLDDGALLYRPAGTGKPNFSRGGHRYNVKLTEDDVRAIRQLADGARLSNVAIAKAHGVSEATVRKILNGLIWTDVA